MSTMKDKKLLIIISTITLLLILLIIILLINNSNSKLKSEITTYNNVTIESTTTTSLTNSTGILNENNPGGGDHGGGATTTIVGTTSTTTKSTTSKITTSITSTTRNISYTCPDGYVLNGAICTSTMDAKYACSENTTDYSNEDIPKNTYCVNLSEAYDKPESGCPEGVPPRKRHRQHETFPGGCAALLGCDLRRKKQ